MLVFMNKVSMTGSIGYTHLIALYSGLGTNPSFNFGSIWSVSNCHLRLGSGIYLVHVYKKERVDTQVTIASVL